MKRNKLLPVLAALLMLGGCTGSCTSGTQTVPVPTTPPSQRQDSAPPSVETPQPPAPTQEPDEPLPETPAPTPAPPPPAVTAVPAPTPSPTPAPTPEPEPDPDDEAVLAAYRQAVEAFGWFQMTHLPLDMEAQASIGELTYYRVDYPGLDTLTALRGYLKNLFSDALVDELLPIGGTQYVEVEGVLYGIDGGRGSDITKGTETVQVLRDGPGRCTVRVEVELLDPEQDFTPVGSASYEFPYEKIGEQWIFTAFSLVR